MSTNRSFGDSEMELPGFVVSEAKQLVEAGAVLPSLIPGSADFYVAAEKDQSIQSFGGVQVRGVVYKIGTQK